MSVAVSLDNLFSFLSERKLNPVFEKEKGQIHITIPVKDHSLFIFFGLVSEDLVIQQVAYLPFITNSDRVSEMARLLHIINREIDLPGFGMDENAMTIFYRLALPCPDKKFNPKLLELTLATAKMICETFVDIILQVSEGKSSVETITKKT